MMHLRNVIHPVKLLWNPHIRGKSTQQADIEVAKVDFIYSFSLISTANRILIHNIPAVCVDDMAELNLSSHLY